MAAKEMTVRACRDGGFVVYDRIQMVQNPDPIAAFGDIGPALDFVLKTMVPVVAVDQPASMQEQHLREVELEFEKSLRRDPIIPAAVRGDANAPYAHLAISGAGRPVPRDEPLMEDDRS